MRIPVSGWLVVASLSVWLDLRGQLPQPRLDAIFPPGARAGSTTGVTVNGGDLDGPVTLRFSDTRLSATWKPGTAGEFEVNVPTDVPVGLVDVRFEGRFGLSNPRAFAVGGLPEVSAPATNTTPAAAAGLSPDVTVNGRVPAGGKAWFQFPAEAGQRLVVRLLTGEIDSRLVPDLTVMDPAGREVAVARRRPWLDFTAPVAGVYRLALHDQTFRGGDDFAYRLTLTARPHLDYVLPAVLQSGGTRTVVLYGRHLPGGEPSQRLGVDGIPLERMEVDVVAPAQTEAGGGASGGVSDPLGASLDADLFAWRMPGAGDDLPPVLFALGTNPVVVRDGDGLAAVTPPCEFAAFFPQRGGVSGVTFRAEKGEVLWLELFSGRLGHPVDPHVVIQRELPDTGPEGQPRYADVLEAADLEANIGDREFPTQSRDPAARFEAPEGGTYRVLVRDRFHLGASRPRYPYRLSVRRETPDFRLVALPMPPPRAGDDRKVHVRSVTLRREETIALKVLALRRDGFDGEIELTAGGLPEGVEAATTRLAAGQAVGTLLLTASGSASGLTGAVLEGRATVSGVPVTRRAPLASVVWPVPDFNNENAVSRLARDVPVAVVSAEQAPVSILPPEGPALQTPADGELNVALRIVRRGEFPAAFQLKPAGHPALDKAAEITVAEKATEASVVIKLSESKLPPGTHTLWFQGSVAGTYRNDPEGLAAAEAALKAADEALAAVSGADKAAAEERRKLAEAARKAAEERAKPRTVTVPVVSRPFVVVVSPPPQPEGGK